ncbi:MAG: tryptophan synthase subunit alpha [Gammaproteobacteria bacterium]
MNRINACFEKLNSDRMKGLIAFVTAGDPTLEATPDIMHALVAGGADIIELGVPFSDPMADGEVIQRASERALSLGTSLSDVLDCVGVFRQKDLDTPVVLMGYCNPFQRMGLGTLADRCNEVGADGILVVDLPPEEAAPFKSAFEPVGIAQIFLVAPNSPEERIRKICEYASGFVYFVAVKGVTGDKQFDGNEIKDNIDRTKSIAGIPVGLGFGIRNSHAAVDAAAISDGVVVGSAIVEIIEKGETVSEIAENVTHFVRELRTSINQSI